jgi:serine/threonine protein kinase
MSVGKIGRYELRSMLARTPSSTVYEGWDALIARKVAVKIVPVPDRSDPETHELLIRFGRGAQAAGMLNHPNIVAVYDYGETEDSAYLVMELVDGVTLKTLLETSKGLAPEAMLRIVDDVAAALTYSHGHGVVHRDIKPRNAGVYVARAVLGRVGRFTDRHLFHGRRAVSNAHRPATL